MKSEELIQVPLDYYKQLLEDSDKLAWLLDRVPGLDEDLEDYEPLNLRGLVP